MRSPHSALLWPSTPFPYLTLCFFLVQFFARQPATEVSTQVTSTANSRPCSANPVLAPSSKSKSAKKSKHPLLADPLPSCIEVKGQPIEIQEFLQSDVRELQWHIGENPASEDTWRFVRYLNEEELAKCGGTKVLVEPAQFTGGKAAVLIRTTDLNDGLHVCKSPRTFKGKRSPPTKSLRNPVPVGLCVQPARSNKN
jgi:hypothetical protein